MKKKSNKKILWFTDPVYCLDYCVVMVPTHKEFIQIAKKEVGFDVEPCPNISGEFHGLTNNKYPDLALVWTSDKDLNLTHELFHATTWVLRNRSIYLTADTEETFAYYLCYLIRTVKNFIKYGL